MGRSSSRTLTNRREDAEVLGKSTQTHREKIEADFRTTFAPYMSRANPPLPVGEFIDLVVHAIDGAHEHAVEMDRENLNAINHEAAVRDKLGLKRVQCLRRMSRSRESMEMGFGKAGLRAVPFDRASAAGRATELLGQMERASGLLRDFDPTKVSAEDSFTGIGMADPVALADAIEESSVELRNTIEEFELAKQETKLSLNAKKESLKTLNDFYVGGLGLIEGLYLATGNEELIKSLRPARFRRRKSRRGAENDPPTEPDRPAVSGEEPATEVA